jgi:ribosomal protein L32
MRRIGDDLAMIHLSTAQVNTAPKERVHKQRDEMRREPTDQALGMPLCAVHCPCASAARTLPALCDSVEA